MGAKLTALENRSNVDMEIRVFVPPSRPDRYRKIIRIRPGETKLVKLKNLCCEDANHDEQNPTFLMVFMDGIYTGVSLFPFDIAKYAKILGYLDENTGNVILRGIKTKFSCFLRLKDSCISWKSQDNQKEGSSAHPFGTSTRAPVQTGKFN